MEDDLEVPTYLNQYPQLRTVLGSLHEQVRRLFGETELQLEIFQDPEDGDSSGKLFALIPTTLSANDACVLLERLDNEWWLDQPAEMRRLMNVDLQYVG